MAPLSDLLLYMTDASMYRRHFIVVAGQGGAKFNYFIYYVEY